MEQLLFAITKIQDLLELTNKEMAGLFDVSEKKYNRYIENPNNLPLGALKYFSETLELDHNNLISGIIDYQTLFERWGKGVTNTIPSKYQKSAGSRVRTIGKMLLPIEKVMGDHFVEKILWHFQLNRELLDCRDQLVNVNLIVDLFHHLRENWNFTEYNFKDIGLNSHSNQFDHNLYLEIGNCSGPYKLYEKIFTELTPHYEKNFDYKILKLTKSKMVLECLQKRERTEALNRPIICSPDSCAYREGIIASMPRMIGLNDGSLKTLKSVHQGDHSTVYEVEFHSSSLH